jgi:hypothetical protein
MYEPTGTLCTVHTGMYSYGYGTGTVAWSTPMTPDSKRGRSIPVLDVEHDLSKPSTTSRRVCRSHFGPTLLHYYQSGSFYKKNRKVRQRITPGPA